MATGKLCFTKNAYAYIHSSCFTKGTDNSYFLFMKCKQKEV